MTTESIRSIEEHPGEMIRVLIGWVDNNGEFLMTQDYQRYVIHGDDLTELMSESPPWAPGKPAGTYRNEDLWIFINRQREA